MEETLPINFTESAQKREEIAIFSEYEKELQLMQTCIKKPSEETMQKIYSRIRLLNIQSN